MRILGPFCICALFVAGMWAFEPLGWGEGRSVDGLDWRNAIAPGRTLTVQNLNGPITVTSVSGGEVHVTAKVGFNKSDPKAIRFQIKDDARGPKVCALWPGMDSCDGPGKHQNNHEGDDLTVAFEVQLPAGVAFEGATVNGNVDVRGATGGVGAVTVNGDVAVDSSTAPLRAETVNGRIDVRLGELGPGDVRMATVNGDILAQLPQRFDAEVSARTVSGRITILGKEYQARVRTTVGRGGPKVSAQNVSGTIAIR